LCTEDYQLDANNISLPSGQAVTNQTLSCVLLQPEDDMLIEGNETFNIEAVPTNSLDTFMGGSNQSIEIEITDNDGNFLLAIFSPYLNIEDVVTSG